MITSSRLQFFVTADTATFSRLVAAQKTDEQRRKLRNFRARFQRREKDEMMSSLGLTKVKSQSGKVYYE